MVKFPREKKVILIDEDSYLPVASINITAFDFKALIDSNKARGIPPSVRIIKAWISKQYLTYKNDMARERGMFGVREKKKRGHPNHSCGKKSMGLGKEAKKKKFSKEKNVSPKERHASPRKNGMNNPLRRKMHSRFVISPTISSLPE